MYFKVAETFFPPQQESETDIIRSSYLGACSIYIFFNSEGDLIYKYLTN